MKKRTLRWGILLTVLVILILLAIAGGWHFMRSSFQTADGPPPSPVLVFVTSPPSGDEANAGDFVQVTVQAVAPSPIARTELFVDGMSLGSEVDSPGNAAWTWQAWPLGVHTFYARSFTSDGQIGQSQTVIVNVLAGDGMMQVFAEEGQTLEQVGADFGIPPDQMAGTNPILDPTQPLAGGQPVQVPVGGAGPGGGSGNGGGAGAFNPILVTWQFTPTEPVDQSYCYTSTGNGVWEKMPKEPFEFFGGAVNFYTLVGYDSVNQYGVIQMQCWGWLGATLKYLGQAETSFDAQNPPNQVAIVGDGFEFVGIPEIPPESGGGAAIPPPFGLREASSVDDCLAHGDPIVAGSLCGPLIEAQVKENVILVWEWNPEACWPGFCQYDVTEIGGYGVYEIDPFTNSQKYLANIKPSAMKVAFVPLPWGPTCYGVEAYMDAPGMQTSEMAMYCPGAQTTAKKITLTKITNWAITENPLQTHGCTLKFQQEHLPGLGLGTLIPEGFGSKPGEVFVGAYRFETGGGVAAGSDCYEDNYFNSAVKFQIEVSLLPAGAVFQKATLRFFVPYQNYDDGLSPTPPTGTCVNTILMAKKDWSEVGNPSGSWPPWVKGELALYSDYYGPGASVTLFPTVHADVTATVKEWLTNPGSNHGFILITEPPPVPYSLDQLTLCYSALSNFELDIYYVAP